MATLTERLILLISADSKGAVAGLEATGAAAEKNLTPIEARARSATAGVATIGIAVAAVGGALALGLKSADEAFVDLGRQTRGIQRWTGDTAEDASKLVFVAQRSGVEFDKIGTSITRLA